ncbi:PREDICTED: serine/arginine repetitive matrix protein 1-like [Ceratotherium simum simum]|uniref:Serine/arginine repetitive matrix protein 1-like n=1 Tax=Ceratotherium simum simum TaxID=73337 RepID=A0ABM1CK89_CERSS|nr:PREDICTED: serine/arginine repetitive matrix protein 1-like [Ceratotherium simum simum]
MWLELSEQQEERIEDDDKEWSKRRGSAALLAKLLRRSVPALAEPSPSSSRAPKTSSSAVPEGQLREERSRRRSLDARVTEPVFVLFKKQIPIRAKPPYPRGIGGTGSKGPGVESENKRIQPAVRASGGGRESPPRHPERPEPPRSRPAPAALPRRRPQPPALPDPPRTRFLRSRTPALASPRDKAGQFSPLLGRGDSRRDVNTARPAALGPSPSPGSVTSSLSPAPRPAPPTGRRAARRPLSPSPAPRPLPGALSPVPQLPAVVTATGSGKPLRKPRSKQHRRGAGARREAAALGTARLYRRALGAPSHQPRPPALLPAVRVAWEDHGVASLSAGPRTRHRRRRWPGVRREPGPPRQPEPLHWERRRQNSGAPPRAANYHPPNGRAARRLVPAFAECRAAGLSAQLRSAAGGPLALPPELRAPAPSHCRSSLGQQRRSNSKSEYCWRENCGSVLVREHFGPSAYEFENENPAVAARFWFPTFTQRGTSEQGTHAPSIMHTNASVYSPPPHFAAAAFSRICFFNKEQWLSRCAWGLIPPPSRAPAAALRWPRRCVHQVLFWAPAFLFLRLERSPERRRNPEEQKW